MFELLQLLKDLELTNSTSITVITFILLGLVCELVRELIINKNKKK